MSSGILHNIQQSSHTSGGFSGNLSHHQDVFQQQIQQQCSSEIMTPSTAKYECSLCNILFGSRIQFQVHANTYHREMRLLPFSCSYCQKGFFSKVGVAQHELSHKGYVFPCSRCSSKFTFKRNLRRHMETIHHLKECRYCGAWIEIEHLARHVLECSCAGNN